MNNVIADCEVLVTGSISRENLFVIYDSRAFGYSELEQENITSLWSAALAKNSNKLETIFNGNLFSLHKWRHDNGKLYLELENTCYMNYLATRNKVFRRDFPDAHLANPLAVCSVLLTRDSYIIVEKRSGGDVYSNAFHVIGGFMDRDMDIKNHTTPDPFFSIEREVMEEIFVDISKCNGVLTGFVYDKRTPHPELCFSYPIDFDLAEVLVRLRMASSKEVGEIIGLSNDEESISKFFLDNLDSTSVTGLGCLLLHGLNAFGNAWYADICGKLQLRREVGSGVTI